MQALARLQFMRIAFGAAGSAGAELDLGEVGRLLTGLMEGSKVSLDWQAAHVHWPKDWAKLLMNATLLAADCLQRGGQVKVETGADTSVPSFKVVATGTHTKVLEETEKALRGESGSNGFDARAIQPYLTHKLSREINAALTLTAKDGAVELVAG
jgi:histidine phosphotransferase ChpT